MCATRIFIISGLLIIFGTLSLNAAGFNSREVTFVKSDGRQWKRWVMTERTNLVNQAISLCYPNGTATLSCSPDSTKVQELNTYRLDKSLNLLKIKVKELTSKLDATSLATVLDNSKSYYIGPELLWSWNSVSGCSAFDFLYSDKNMIENMSSNPATPFSKRYGL
jgi:hypothetical protein